MLPDIIPDVPPLKTETRPKGMETEAPDASGPSGSDALKTETRPKGMETRIRRLRGDGPVNRFEN